MTLLDTLKQTYQSICNNCPTPDRLAFGKALVAENSPEILDFHYWLLSETDMNTELYQTVARQFAERGEGGERYLLSKIQQEPDTILKATVLQILGTFRYRQGKHLDEISNLARTYLRATEPELRNKALLVIGWTGQPEDIDQIAFVLNNDPIPENRSWAATALMQLFFTYPQIARRSLDLLQVALKKETASHPEYAILVSMQEIGEQNWGLSPTSESGNPEKVSAAKIMALQLNPA